MKIENLSPLTFKIKKRIIATCLDLYMKSYYRETKSETGQVLLALDNDFTTIIENVIMDNGLIYFRDSPDFFEFWNSLVSLHVNNKETYQFNLINITRTFRAVAFKDYKEYKEWISELAKSMSGMAHDADGEMLQLIPRGDVPSYVACDEDTFERMVEHDTLFNVMNANPWVVFLYTLSLATSDIVQIKLASDLKLV